MSEGLGERVKRVRSVVQLSGRLGEWIQGEW